MDEYEVHSEVDQATRPPRFFQTIVVKLARRTQHVVANRESENLWEWVGKLLGEAPLP